MYLFVYLQTGFTKDSLCDPGGTQTHDLQNRNLTLYSTKLPGQVRGKSKHNLLVSQPIDDFIFVPNATYGSKAIDTTVAVSQHSSTSWYKLQYQLIGTKNGTEWVYQVKKEEPGNIPTPLFLYLKC